ncbi:benzoate-CoA ligase family protein [Nocardia sp. R7R-8]|uniref:benzoate-CoA ligase family protein n=1 Tax=Nocardia sp. R7R-8 TaxID=3459304 RepID=UPI00403D8704
MSSNPQLFNAAHYLVDRHLENGYGGRTAVVTSQRTLTYAELAQEVHRVAGALRALGLRPEERVMLCMADDVELLTGILGAIYLGAVPVPVSTMLTGTDLGKLLADSRARILCASKEFVTTVVAAVALAPEVTDVIFDSEPEEMVARVTVHHWDDLVSAAVPVSTAYQTWADSPALWLYTSGTTGLPKAAMHQHGNIRAVAESYGAQVLGIQPHDRVLSVAKLFFAYGIGNSCFLPLSVGATSILERARPTPAGIAERIRAGRPTLFFGVPTFFASLLASEVPDDTFAGVRLGISAGEALPPALFERMGARFGVEVLDGIGATEALHIFLSNQCGRVRPGSSGVPVPGYEVQLRDDDDRVIEAAGVPGALYLRGISTATGYWCRSEATRQVFQGVWLRTGDMYVRNEDGSYSCLGRLGDMLKAGGIWVSPAEVEERLLRHPDVAEVAVVAAPDDAGLDKPVACVVAQPGRTVDADALIAWCREGLASFKRPRAVVALEQLPKTPTGKIRRNVLRGLVAGQLRNGSPRT